ncbi:MAG: cupin domain-containing protein [Streptosporangiales bacterium]|nr:cupin domain-containing protein [Streptosporangiales bacterium]
MTEPQHTDAAFTGEAELEALGELAETTVRVNRVTFQPGARTHWHSHAGGQLLHAVSGHGLMQEQGQAVVRFAAGDTVSTAPGVEHWHGAADDETMVHIAVSGGVTDWGGPAADAR